jgi:hypothetical protein
MQAKDLMHPRGWGGGVERMATAMVYPANGAAERITRNPPVRWTLSLFPRAAQAYSGSGRSQHFLLGWLLLDVDPSLEVGAVLNGDALARDVARDHGRLL